MEELEKKIEQILEADGRKGASYVFLKEELLELFKEEGKRIKLMGYVDSNNNVQVLDEAHIKELIKMVLNHTDRKDKAI